MKDRNNQDQDKEAFVLVISTANGLEEAERMAELLVKERAAACVSVSSPVLSVYRWQENIESEKEVMLFIKTTAANYQKVERLITENHSYEVPEIIAMPIVDGEEKYLRWMADNTRE